MVSLKWWTLSKHKCNSFWQIFRIEETNKIQKLNSVHTTLSSDSSQFNFKYKENYVYYYRNKAGKPTIKLGTPELMNENCFLIIQTCWVSLK